MKIQFKDKLILTVFIMLVSYILWNEITYQEVPARTGYEKSVVKY